ncbi:MAG: hypothetical protein IJZ44_01890 [Lachnospiraceae bacterium]|nr:hypothetical protein [Lachnospiraceae bacterium]
MSIEDKCRKKNIELQKHLQIEIDNVKNGISNKNLEQLYGIMDELKKVLDNKKVVLFFPRIIVDSWDFQDELGNELLDFEELYRRWK